jgi:hypothetical protein
MENYIGSMEIKELTISAIKSCEVHSDKLYDTLLELSSYKHEDAGFSFFVRKSYIKGYIQDVKNDLLRKAKDQVFGGIKNKDRNYIIDKQEEISQLEKLISNMKGEILLIDNDGLVK